MTEETNQSKPAICKGCGAEIAFVKSQAGKMIPVNARYTTVVTDDGTTVRGRVSHFATCPRAEQFRTRRNPA
jgi:hypothetical protein